MSPFPGALAQVEIQAPAVDVTAAPGDLFGEATAASEGTVGQREIESRPSLRPADVLELVPGVIVTQHSGAGKRPGERRPVPADGPAQGVRARSRPGVVRALGRGNLRQHPRTPGPLRRHPEGRPVPHARARPAHDHPRRQRQRVEHRRLRAERHTLDRQAAHRGGPALERVRFRLASNLPENSGKASASVLLPKAQVVLGPWARTEYYLSYGQGFHSNDARGVTTRVNPDPRDPGFLQQVEPVTALPKTTGYEVGLRSIPFEGFQTTLALWNLDLDSELLFVGDAGTTEPSRPSRRYGVEWYAYYAPRSWVAFDLLAAYTKARFTDDDPVGDRIPGAIQTAVAGGATLFPYQGWFGSLRFRYFGARPLVEDDSVRSSSSTIWNLRAGYQFGKRAQLAVEVINLLDAKVSDIDYFYESQLAAELAPVGDIHTHPAAPRTFRLAVILGF